MVSRPGQAERQSGAGRSGRRRGLRRIHALPGGLPRECIRGGIQGTQKTPSTVVSFDTILPNLTQLKGYEPMLRYFWSEGLFDSQKRATTACGPRHGDEGAGQR
jgi:hypothetical protein